MRIVKIDGNLFGVTIPIEKDLRLVSLDPQGDPQQGKLFLDREFCFLGDQKTLDNKCVLYRKFSKRKDTPILVGSDGTADSQGQCVEVEFLPVLIPLTANHIPDDCQKDNPNFEVSCGGTIYRNREPIRFPWHAETMQDLEIGDTDPSCSMVWMWLNGKLYYCGQSMRIHVQELVSWLQLTSQ